MLYSLQFTLSKTKVDIYGNKYEKNIKDAKIKQINNDAYVI